MDIPERVNNGYSNKDIRTVDFLVSIVIFIKRNIAIKIIISAHKITNNTLSLKRIYFYKSVCGRKYASAASMKI
jgi:hypothetical protein